MKYRTIAYETKALFTLSALCVLCGELDQPQLPAGLTSPGSLHGAVEAPINLEAEFWTFSTRAGAAELWREALLDYTTCRPLQHRQSHGLPERAVSHGVVLFAVVRGGCRNSPLVFRQQCARRDTVVSSLHIHATHVKFVSIAVYILFSACGGRRTWCSPDYRSTTHVRQVPFLSRHYLVETNHRSQPCRGNVHGGRTLTGVATRR